MHNPSTWLELALMELSRGWSFKADLWLASLRDHVRQLSPQKRRSTFKVLHKLGRVKQGNPRHILALLHSAQAETIAHWTDEYFATVTEPGFWERMQ